MSWGQTFGVTKLSYNYISLTALITSNSRSRVVIIEAVATDSLKLKCSTAPDTHEITHIAHSVKPTKIPGINQRRNPTEVHKRTNPKKRIPYRGTFCTIASQGYAKIAVTAINKAHPAMPILSFFVISIQISPLSL